MSNRVTRSTAKKSAESSSSPPTDSPQPALPASTSRNTRKRKASQKEPSPDPPPENSLPPSYHRSKKHKPDPGEPPTQPPLSSKAKKKGKAPAMSSSKTPMEISGEGSTSPPDTSSSSKKKSGKTKKSSTNDANLSPSVKRTKASSNKKSLNPANDSPRTPQPKAPDAVQEDSGDEDEEGYPDGYDPDEAMDEDSFESSILRRHGRMGGLSNTLRALSGMMSGLTSQFNQILENLKKKDDPSDQFLALERLSQILLVSTEDISGQFSPEPFVKELVVLMQPPDFGIENPDMMLLACRCLANMIEALPSSTSQVVYGGAVPVLLSNLREIQYMDLAEQALITLEKISVEFPSTIVRDGGLAACLTFLDFFATSTQRTAVTTAANCCRNIPNDCFPAVKEVMDILLNVLNSSDQKVVEQGCLCVSRIVESYKYHDDKLEELMGTELLRVILRLLLPGSTNMIGPSIHTQFLHVLSVTARASPSLTVELFKMNIVDTLYQILTGVSPPTDLGDAAQKIDTVVIMQALIHRPKDQVFETLNVVVELLPGLDKNDMEYVDDLLDHVGIPSDVILSKAKRPDLQKRLSLLADCREELRKFATILLPTLTDAYLSTVNFSVRQKVLSAQLKMLSHLDVDILEEALRAVPYASFLASILSEQDHALLVAAALQAAEFLLKRMGPIYRYQFYREGVMAEIKKLANRSETDGFKQPESTGVSDSTATGSSAQVPTSLSEGEHHSITEEEPSDSEMDESEGDGMDEGQDEVSDSSDSSASPPPQSSDQPLSGTQEVITKIAKKFMQQFDTEEFHETREKAASIMEDLQTLVTGISECYEAGQADEGAKLFVKLARYFEGDALESMTSYELLNSKIVTTLLDIFEDASNTSNNAARSAFVEIFMGTTIQSKVKTASSKSPVTPFSILIHKLQDLLSRAEHFEVNTLNNSYDSSRGSTPNMLAKLMRVHLVADDNSGIPKEYRRIIASVHAIATIKALDDFLRPRITLMEHTSSGRQREVSASGAGTSAATGGEASSYEGFSGRPGLATPPSFSSNQSGSRGSSRQRLTAKAGASAASPGNDEAESSTSAGNKASSKTRSSKQSKASNSGAFLPPPPPQPPFGDGSPESGNMQNALECADESKISDEEDVDESGALNAIVGELEDEGDEDQEDASAVNMEVASTGKVTARQEDGTRVATPTQGTPAPRPLTGPSRPMPSSLASSLLSGLSSRSMSYAAAVRAIPQDWHLEYTVNDQKITPETTIFRAIHIGKQSFTDVSARNLWNGPHTINFKRVPGPPPEPSLLTPPPDGSTMTSSGLPESLDSNPTTAGILRLLRILHEMNSHLDDVLADNQKALKLNAEPLAQFVNTKLTAKLNRQLEEPLIVASNCLPGWSEDLARLYPFLFPFETRHLFLQSTSFGYSRSMSRWQNSQIAADSRRDRHRDERPPLGKLQRQKVRISRTKILESAMKVMELYGASPSLLEVEYFQEEGTGLGPTLEFYSTVSKEFSKKKLRLWRDNDSNSPSEFAFGQQGLFPAPMSAEQAETANGKKILAMFSILGKFVARSMLDSRIIDVSFNPIFFRSNDKTFTVSPSLGAVNAVDQDLANSLQTLKQFVTSKKKIDENPRLNAAQKAQKTAKIQVSGASIEDLSLDFTLPGYPSIELIDDGANVMVTIDNVEMYIEKVVDFTLGQGVQRQIEAFRSGFSQVFPYSALRAFTPDELVMLFGRIEEDWSLETLTDSIKVDHGYNLDSKSVRNLLQFMSELSVPARRDFLQFITGSPKLPIGGFKSLTPLLTVVRKPSEPPYTSDDYLPSVMTCVNYLKLPDYTNLDLMSQKLQVAMKEGQGAFHLS